MYARHPTARSEPEAKRHPRLPSEPFPFRHPQPESEIDDDGKKILDALRASYRRITDGVATFPRQATFKGDDLISDYTMLCLVAQYVDLESHETRHFSRLGKALRAVPLYIEFLEPIRGIGPAMAGVIITEIDIAKARYPSSLWKYAGLDQGPDGRGRGRYKEHLVEREYTDSEGKSATRQGITYNPFLKTKLMGVLAPSFLRCGVDDNPYRAIYDGHKHRIESRPDTDKEKKGWKGHIHNRALRYMIKMFLIDLYNAWRPLEGLHVAPPYHEAKLGMHHGDKAA